MSEPTQTAYERLSPQRKRFVDAYIGPANCNGARAAREAGYAERSAKQQAHINLSNPDVKAAITERLEELAMPAAEVLARLTSIARGSLEDFIEVQSGGGKRVDLKKAEGEGKLHLLQELADTEFGLRIKVHNPLTALELLGKHHRLFVDKVEMDATLHDEGAVESLHSKLDGLAARLAAEGVPGEPDADGSGPA